MNKRVFLNIASFVFITLMFFKVSSAHVYAHQDDDSDKIENCKICDSAIENQQAEHLKPTTFNKEITAQIAFELKPLFRTPQTFTSSVVDAQPYCRPPPSLV